MYRPAWLSLCTEISRPRRRLTLTFDFSSIRLPPLLRYTFSVSLGESPLVAMLFETNAWHEPCAIDLWHVLRAACSSVLNPSYRGEFSPLESYHTSMKILWALQRLVSSIFSVYTFIEDFFLLYDTPLSLSSLVHRGARKTSKSKDATGDIYLCHVCGSFTITSFTRN